MEQIAQLLSEFDSFMLLGLATVTPSGIQEIIQPLCLYQTLYVAMSLDHSSNG